MANKINFTANGAPTRTLKAAPARYRLSPGRPNISQSDGIRPAFPLLPFKHLPTAFQDISTEDYVVIPKGRLISAITSNDDPASVIGDGNDYYGVARGIMGLMVPANGGVARVVTSPVTDAGDFTIPANKPVGVTEHDVFQDMRGENLNYDMRNKNYGILSRQLIKLPAIDVATFSEMVGDADCFLPGDAEAAGTAGEHVHTITTAEVFAEVETEYVYTVGAGITAPVEIPLATMIDALTLTHDNYIFTVTGATVLVGGDGEVITASYAAEVLTLTSNGAYTEGMTVTVTYQYINAQLEIPVATMVSDEALAAEQYSYVVTAETVTSGAEVVTATYADAVLTLVTDTVFTDEATITVAYVYTDLNSDVAAPVTNADLVTDSYAYATVEAEYSFFTFNGENATVEAVSGKLLKPDYYGNFMPHSSYDEQTVGRLLGVDYRFGKDMLDTVQSKYEETAGYRVAGTGTKGVPQFLFNFAYDAITAALVKGGTTWEAKWPSVDPSAKILEFCEGGAIGEAWIQLNV